MSPSDTRSNRRAPGGGPRHDPLPASGNDWIVLIPVFAVLFASAILAEAWLRQPEPPRELALEFTVPMAPDERREPLVTTGVFGAGDLFYVWYRDAESIVFGYDSWGAGGPLSQSVAAKAGQTLKLRIALPALQRPEKGRGPKELLVSVDGREVWRVRVNAHACTLSSVQWAENRIRGSSCSQSNSGVLRREGAHRLEGTGLRHYYTHGERLRFWYERPGRWSLFSGILSLLVAWWLVYGVRWGAVEGWLRSLATPPEWMRAGGKNVASHKEGDETEPCSWLKPLPALPFLAGFVLAFASCIGAGYAVSERPLFRDFVRFFYPLQPQTLFYPTARELVAQVEGTVPKDKVLVLVGGASYFRGTGQNPSELWTHELQRLLGSEYAVVNLAIDQAGPPAFGGVAYQMLARKYPRSVYVCSGGPHADDPLDGGEVYRYLYWDAHYKRLLQHEAGWAERVERERDRQTRTPEGGELHLGKRLDALTFACDLWTWFAHDHAFTVWSDAYPLHPFRARGRYREGDDLLLRQRQLDARRDEALVKLLEERNRDESRAGHLQGADGRWTLDPGARSSIASHYARMLPPSVRARSVVVLMHGNPYFKRTLTDEDRGRIVALHDAAEEVLESLGYRAVQAGLGFTEDDYLDGGHFMPSGGRKVARIVADEILAMKP